MATAEAAGDAAETIVCDTSFVSVVQARGFLKTWPADVRDRLDNAVLAISVITLAELRSGHISARWGAKRRANAEGVIATYLWIPLDMATVDEWARLQAACKSSGVTTPHNDVWIAATANVRGCTLVSCDKHFDSVPDVYHVWLDPSPT